MSYSKDYRYKFKKMCEKIGIFNNVGDFMKIDGKSYKVFSISKDFIRFNDKYDVILRVGLEDSTKKTIVLFFTEDTYWLEGNQFAQKAISELQCEIILGMTNELFYKKSVAKTYGSYDLSGCVCSSEDK